MKSEAIIKRELEKIQKDIQQIESELQKHTSQIVELEESLAKDSSGSVEEMLQKNKSVMKEIQTHIEEKSYLAIPLKSLRGRESYLRKRLFEFEKEYQVEQHNQRMIKLYDALTAYNELVDKSNSLLGEIKALYQNKLLDEYREGVDREMILKCPVGSPSHIQDRELKPITISNGEKILEAKSNA